MNPTAAALRAGVQSSTVYRNLKYTTLRARPIFFIKFRVRQNLQRIHTVSEQAEKLRPNEYRRGRRVRRQDHFLLGRGRECFLGVYQTATQDRSKKVPWMVRSIKRRSTYV